MLTMQSYAAKTQELIERARRGELSARHALVDLHRDDLRRIIEIRLDRELGGHIDAEDIVQDVLVDVWRRLDEFLFVSDVPFLTWLRQMVGQRIVATYDRHMIGRGRGLTNDPGVMEIPADSACILSGHSFEARLSPDTDVGHTVSQARLKQALCSLTADDREILVMRHIERLGVDRIAAVLETSERTAMLRLMNALLRLRERLGGDADTATEN